MIKAIETEMFLSILVDISLSLDCTCFYSLVWWSVTYLLAISVPSFSWIFLATVTAIILTFTSVVDIITIVIANPTSIAISWCFSWSVSRSLGSWSWRWGRWASISAFLKNQRNKSNLTVIFLMAFCFIKLVERAFGCWKNEQISQVLDFWEIGAFQSRKSCLSTCLFYSRRFPL